MGMSAAAVVQTTHLGREKNVLSQTAACSALALLAATDAVFALTVLLGGGCGDLVGGGGGERVGGGGGERVGGGGGDLVGGGGGGGLLATGLGGGELVGGGGGDATFTAGGDDDAAGGGLVALVG